MSLAVAEDRAKWRRKRTKCKSIGGGAGADQETRDRALENVIEKLQGLGRPWVGAIGQSRALVRGENRRENDLTCPGGVVAREIHDIPGAAAGRAEHPAAAMWRQPIVFLRGPP
jgi:hypothetical protein